MKIVTDDLDKDFNAREGDEISAVQKVQKVQYLLNTDCSTPLTPNTKSLSTPINANPISEDSNGMEGIAWLLTIGGMIYLAPIYIAIQLTLGILMLPVMLTMYIHRFYCYIQYEREYMTQEESDRIGTIAGVTVIAVTIIIPVAATLLFR